MVFSNVIGRRALAGVAAAALSVSLAACAQGGGTSRASDDATIKNVEIIAPANPGSGWDGLARSLQDALDKTKLANRVEVTNVPGASGTVALAQYASQNGKQGTWIASGLAMMSGVLMNKTEKTLDDLTPLARLNGESELVVVPADSPYQSIDDLASAVKSDPGVVAIAGGSAGSADHIFLGLWAQEYGIDPSALNYVPFSGGGEATTALLGGKVAAGVAGTAEFAEQVTAGKLRPLLVSANEQVSSVPNAPTVTDAGKPNLDFYNWRSVLAPPGITDDEREQFIAVLTKLKDTDEWKQIQETNAWTDLFLAGDEFASWQQQENDRVQGVLTDLGLA